LAKRRTAKQKAATRKLVALNKRKRSTRKGGVRKTARRAYMGLRKRPTKRRKSSSLSTRKRTNSMRRTRRRSSSRSKIGNVFNRGTVGKVVAGVGAAALVGAVMDRFLPASPVTAIAKPIAAYASGGAAGAIGSVILDGGLNSIANFFGMQSQSTNQVQGGGFSV